MVMEEEKEAPQKFETNQQLYWMQSGRFIATENGFRMDGAQPMKRVLEFIRSQKGSESLTQEKRVKAVRKQQQGPRQRAKLSSTFLVSKLQRGSILGF